MSNVEDKEFASNETKKSKQTFVLPPELLSQLGIQIKSNINQVDKKDSTNVTSTIVNSSDSSKIDSGNLMKDDSNAIHTLFRSEEKVLNLSKERSKVDIKALKNKNKVAKQEALCIRNSQNEEIINKKREKKKIEVNKCDDCKPAIIETAPYINDSKDNDISFKLFSANIPKDKHVITNKKQSKQISREPRRKRKKIEIENSESDVSVSNTDLDISSNSLPKDSLNNVSLSTRKRRRKNDNKTLDLDIRSFNSDNEQHQQSMKSISVINNENEENITNLDLSSVNTANDVIKHSENEKRITCMKCDKIVQSTEWIDHKIMHNNLAWNNEETPIDLNDKKSCLNILLKFLKTGNILRCEKCQVQKKSAPGFLSHFQKCITSLEFSKDESKDNNINILDTSEKRNEVTCMKCNKDVLRSNWNNHKLQHNNLAWNNEEIAIDINNKKVCKKILTEFRKKGKLLRCENCTKQKRSVVEFLSHIEDCGKLEESSFNINNTNNIEQDITKEDIHSPSNAKLVICMKCNKTVLKNSWNYHKLEHNNLAWNNIETPIDLNDKDICISILTKLVKKGKTLKCEKCAERKKSVVGFLAHLEKCNKLHKDKSKASDVITSDLDSTSDVCQTPKAAKLKEVTCMKCNATMPRYKWITHNMTHNNLAWNNEETPIDLNNRKQCESILLKLLKKGKTLKCEICNDRKKSAMGFYAHMEVCNKSEEEILLLRVPCEICGRLYSKSSIQVHVNQVHNKSPKPQEPEKTDNVNEISGEKKTKRKAAAKALDLIEDLKKGVVPESIKTVNDLFTTPSKIRIPNSIIMCWKKEITTSEDGKANCRNISCLFRCSDIEELKSHYTQCTLHPKRGYWCKVCNFRCEEEKIMLDHVTKEHKNEMEKKYIENYEIGKNDDDFEVDGVSGSDNELDNDLSETEMDELMTTIDGRHNNTFKNNRNVAKYSYISVWGSTTTQCLLAAKKWTLKFRENNYSKTSLFSDLCNTTSNLVPIALHTTYLSIGNSTSTKMAIVNDRYKKDANADKLIWKSYNRFESSYNESGIATIFCGGPIWGLAWCPLEVEDANGLVEQFLAVSTHKNFDDAFKIDNSLNDKDRKGVIQLWNVGVLKNEIGKCTTEPKLMYMIAHNYGAIWHLEWCPSGGFCEFENISKEKSKRLGLLAVAASDGNIYIFSICFYPFIETNVVPLYYQMPVAVLRIEHATAVSYQVTALTWTKERGHNIIAAGYSNGFVALWNLSTDSQLLKHKHLDILCFHPYLIFKGHLNIVTSLAIFPYLDSSYLLTGSTDRSMQFWKVGSGNGSIQAYPLNGSFGKTNSITAATWNIHWMTALIALDDVYGFGRANSSFFAIRDLTFKSTIVLNSNSLIWDLASCDWTNGFCQVTEGGEISAIYPHQLMAYVDSSKKIKKMRMVIGQCVIKSLQTKDESEVVYQSKEINIKKDISKYKKHSDKEEISVLQSSFVKDEKKGKNKKSTMSKKEKPKTKNNNKNESTSELNTKSPVPWNDNLSDEEAMEENKSSNLIWENKFKDIIQNYGIVFYDFPIDSQSRSYDINEFQNSSSPHYPLNALTRISYNPNSKSYSFTAVGTNAGFVRIRSIDSLKNFTSS